MTRAFQSLLPRELEKYFGPPGMEGSKYSGVGLNIVPPLVQGRSLGPYVRHMFIIQLEQSPDAEIREWPSVRLKQQIKVFKPLKFQREPMMTRKDHQDALQEAIKANTALQDVVSHPHQTLCSNRDLEALNLDSWMKACSEKLQEATGQYRDVVLPIGTSQARMGILLDYAPVKTYEADGVSLPWGLQDSGFTVQFSYFDIQLRQIHTESRNF